MGPLLRHLRRGHAEPLGVLCAVRRAELAGRAGGRRVHGLRAAAAPQPALQRAAVCRLEHRALVSGQCPGHTAASRHLLGEHLTKLSEKEPGSCSGTTKSVCPRSGGVQRCRTCPSSPPVASYEHIPVPQNCACPCTSALLIARSLFPGLPSLSPLLCFYQTHPPPGTGLVSEPGVVKAEHRQESFCPSAEDVQ